MSHMSKYEKKRVTEKNNDNNSMEKQRHAEAAQQTLELSMLETNLFAYMNMMELSKQCECCVWKNDDYNRFHFIYQLSEYI